MKRFWAVVLLSLVVLQMCLLPIAAEGFVCPRISAVTLPATDVVVTTATLNGRMDIPRVLLGNSMENGAVSASLKYTGLEYLFRTFASFQYGTDPGVYTSETPVTQVSASGNVQASVSGLRPCTIYYYRVKLHTEAVILERYYQYRDNTQGAGVGLDYRHLQQLFIEITPPSCPDAYGNEVSFKTLGCITPGGYGTGGAGTGATSSTLSNPSNIVVQSATITNARVSPGEKVDIIASVANKGGSNGTSKVTLYINGQEAESKGVTLSSGQLTTMNFNVSRNDPGTYTVYVNGVSAGSFTVDEFTNNNVLLYSIIALFTIGIIGVLYFIVKRRPA